ncbi:MAG: 30S ribosome-binding factor RbfA [Flavobacteriaceae bacterium]|tara:strand:- start:391 stop:762 length:372 start_codon:yes stop_codon:yes gene_type:complete
MEDLRLTPRQNKFASLIQKEIAILLQKQIREEGLNKLLISVTKVNITSDLSIARIFLSIYPSSQAKKVLESIQNNSFKVKHNLAIVLKNQIRKIPTINFFLDDSLDYIDDIEKALKSKDNPIK